MEDLEDRKVEIEVLDGFYLPPPTYQKITHRPFKGSIK
jgi:hypothetical protein